ncbi:MAG: hypothetical protein V1788_00805 [Nanoarchaeota archaeon]
MKTNNETKNEGAFKPRKNYRWIIHAIYLAIFIAILLLWKCCSGKTEKENQENMVSLIVPLTQENDSLKLRISELENRKAVLIVQNAIDLDNHSGKFVEAIIVPSDDSRESSLFIKDVIKPVKVLVPVECPSIPECPPCPDANKDLVNLIAEMDSLLDASLKVCLTKQYRTDSSKVLIDRNIQIKAFLMSLAPPINYTHTYIEYLPNPYRRKAENSFWRGVGFGAASAGCYIISESLGHPKYWDNRDNSDAEKKSNAIFWWRTGSTVFGAASLFEFGRTIYFHHREGKFIISPTKIGLTINLDYK